MATIITGVIAVLFGSAIGYVIRHNLTAKTAGSVEKKLEKQIEDAKIKAGGIVLDAQKEATALLEASKREEGETKMRLGRLEERLLKKEESLEKESADIKSRDNQINQDVEKLKTIKQEIAELREKAVTELEKVAGFSSNDAKEVLFGEIRKRYEEDLVSLLKKMEHERKEEVEKKGLDIITQAIQRYARSHVSEVTTTAFDLKDEDVKGKIIGREGRNIRALERATGVEFIIDEAPDSIIISSFDPIRREVARMALEKLIKDGRIQPAKIEEKVEESKQELAKRMIELGENSSYELGIYDLPKELIQLLGRLHFRFSYGQNVLVHSIEAAHLASMIASELGINVDVAKKAALLHDIGKAIDHEVQGSHVELGRRILKKYGIAEEVVKAMEAHHEEYPFASSEAYVVAAADAISASRPGARRDTIENYLKRLQDLENIAAEFEGVKTAYAISAGREIRIFVIPEKIDDFAAAQLAWDVAKKIESSMNYPGEIKVNVIREVRAVEYAK